jgi:hypothetical protein
VNCSACGAPRAIADRICKKCRLFFEEGRVVDLAPPRRGDGQAGGPGREALGDLAVELKLRLRATRDRAVVAWPVLVVFGIVPGAGHVLHGLRSRGLGWFAAVGGLLAVSTVLFGNIVGQVLLGITVGVHAYSIFELTPFRSDPRPGVRMFAVVGLQFLLMTLWWPVVRLLADATVHPISVGYRERDTAWDVTVGRGIASAVITCGLVVAVFFVVSWRQRRIDARQGEA